MTALQLGGCQLASLSATGGDAVPANLLHQLRRRPDQHSPEVLRFAACEKVAVGRLVFRTRGHRVEDHALLGLHDVRVDWLAVQGGDDLCSLFVEVL